MRFYDIDLLRFLAALMVVVYHYTFRGYAADEYSALAFSEVDAFTRYGNLGVDLFFMISGFVILLTARNGDPIKFAISRLVRIYPAFWVCVSVTSLILFLHGSSVHTVSIEQWAKNLPLIGGFLGVKMVDGVYWSLLVELKFYALIFMLVLVGKIKSIQIFLALWLLITISAAFGVGFSLLNFFFFPEWSHYFIAGSLFYLVRVEGLSYRKIAMIIVCYLLSLNAALIQAELHENLFNIELSMLVIGGLITVFYGVFVFIALEKTSWINKPIVFSLGALTYPLYLLHQKIGYVLLELFSGLINKYFLLILVIAVVVALSIMVNRFVDNSLGPWFKRSLESISSVVISRSRK